MMMKKKIQELTNKSIILLSGGLDSLVCMGLCRNTHNITLALTFDYGQKSAKKEIAAAKKICEYYKVEHKVIKLDWLKEITNNALVKDKELPHGLDDTINSAKAVWVPNRNGLFLNIAASYADSGEYSYIILGANREEGETFPDNTKEFATRVTSAFEYSTMTKPQVLVPLINSDKNDIVKAAIELSMPLEFVQSCYDSTEGHCGVCESCTRLKNALKNNGDTKYLKLLFKE